MIRRWFHILFVLVLLLEASCTLQSLTKPREDLAAPADGYGTLNKVPFREAWYGMYFREDKIGYSHFKMEPSGSDFTINSDSLLKLTAMKKTSEVAMKEAVSVRPDLTLISFESVVSMNGQRMRMLGTVAGDKLRVEITVDGETLKREYPVQGKCYHSSAVSLMPALKGLKDGHENAFSVFNAEKQGFEPVEQQVSSVQGSPGPGGAVWKVKSLYGRSHMLSWLNKKGLTVLERGLEGSLLTLLEDESTAKNFLQKKGPGKDLVLDMSLIRVSRTIPDPDSLRFLKTRMKGIDPSLIATDHRQRVSNPAGKSDVGFDVTVQVEDPGKLVSPGRTDSAQAPKEYLASSVSIQSDHKEIVEQAQKIVSREDTPLQKMTKLVNWTADNIRNEYKDSFTALAVLRSKEGECQAHANLYAALARSQGIPTRVATGLVYSKQMGFLYHAWAESYIGGWISVDPTLKQIPADATHIKISGGDTGDESTTIHKMIGKVKMEVLEFK